MELWFKKGSQYSLFKFYETSRNVNGGTLTYSTTPAWQSATPTGAVNNVSSSGIYSGLAITAGAVGTSAGSVVTVDGAQTLTSKTLSAPTFSGAYSFGGTPTWPTFNQNTTGSAATLTTARTVQTNLASTSSASFNGSANITPGVTGTLAVANGGSGRATATTAYGLIAAGTTATGAQQTIAPGTSGQFLKSAGASALASFASIIATDISNSTATGRSVLTATDAAAARSAIGAGTGSGDVTLGGTQTLTNKTLSGARVDVINDLNGLPILDFQETASAVNYLTLYNRSAGAEPYFTATGSDTDISIGLVPKGAGDVRIYKSTGGVRIYANGGDTDVDLDLATKGSGVVRANGAEVLTVSGNQTLTNKTFNDNSFTLQDEADNTKKIVFSLGGLDTATTVTLNAPNVSAGTHTIVTRNSTDIMNNKTLNDPLVNNYTEGVVAIGTVTTSSTLDLTNGTLLTATLTASTACTFTMPTAIAGKSFVLMLKQAASTGNGSATFTGVKWNASGVPTITATAGKMDILSFFSDGTNWYGSYTQGYTP